MEELTLASESQLCLLIIFFNLTSWCAMAGVQTQPTCSKFYVWAWLPCSAWFANNSVSEWQRRPGLIFPIIRCSYTKHDLNTHFNRWPLKLKVYSAGFFFVVCKQAIKLQPLPPGPGLEERDSGSSQASLTVNVKMDRCSWEIWIIKGYFIDFTPCCWLVAIHLLVLGNMQ